MTRAAPFHAYCDAFDVYVLVQRRTEVVVSSRASSSWAGTDKNIYDTGDHMLLMCAY